MDAQKTTELVAEMRKTANIGRIRIDQLRGSIHGWAARLEQSVEQPEQPEDNAVKAEQPVE